MLTAAVIGLGRMGLTHLSILNTHPDVEVVAVCDSSRVLLKGLAALMPVECFRDAGKLFAKCDLDVAVIATPPRDHAAVAGRAISAGVHVFIEKPLSLSVEDSRRIVEQARSAGLVTQVGYTNRFNPVFMEVKRLLSEGVLGDLRHVRSEMSGRTVLGPARGSWRGRKDAGGGCLHEFASHCIDLVNYLVGPPDRILASVLQKIHSAEVEDAVYSTLLYDAGLTATIEVNWSDASCRKPTNRIELLGAKGKIVADKQALSLFLADAGGPDAYRRGWNVRHVTDLAGPVRFYVRGNEFTTQLDHFVRCVQDPAAANLCSGADGLETDLTIQRIAAADGHGS